MLAAQGEVASRGDIASRCRLLEQISDARRRSDALFNIVRSESLYERPIPERHRIIFYVGHLEAFDWNLLHENVLGLKSFHAEFDRLFAFGIDPVGGGLPTDQPSDWPSLEAVHDYVSRIRASLDEKLADGSLESYRQGRDGFPLDTLLNVAIEHRLMHVETLAYMLHQLPLDRKVPQENLPVLKNAPLSHRMIKIPAGAATLGLPRTGESFGWDNEFEAHPVHVPEFEISQYEVTNQQYLDFMAAGGYEAREFWGDEDWNWKTANAISHPVFWIKGVEGWLYHGMFEDIPLPPGWPVYVSHSEASAYARWVGKSLPTEAEWQRAAQSSTPGNTGFERWDPVPVTADASMVGNGWEWTSTLFKPFPGFQPFPFYPGYSANFFDDQHYVMKGGSARTATCLLRPSFRNWFQPHYPYVYATFRCVED